MSGNVFTPDHIHISMYFRHLECAALVHTIPSILMEHWAFVIVNPICIESLGVIIECLPSEIRLVSKSFVCYCEMELRVIAFSRKSPQK